MKTSTKMAAVATATLLGACTLSPRIAAPESLAPSDGESLAMVVAASGVQIYECRPGKDPGKTYEWAFVAPEARLFDQRGNPIGNHGAGPYWQADDGSRVEGTVKARADAPVPGAIPWLLLSTRSVGPQGMFSKVTSIQRLSTVGGVAPATGCTEATGGTQKRVDYQADYYLFAKN